MDLEKKLKEIESISAKLANEQTGVSEGIQLFEKSVEITRECLTELELSRKKIDGLKQELDDLLASVD